MKLNTPVTTIMTYNLVKLNLCDDLTKAENLFKKHKIRHIPVVDGQTIVGMLSLSDLLKVSFVEADDNGEVSALVYNAFKLEQVMIKNVITVSPSANIKKVAEILSTGDFHALPVVENGILIGIVTTTDLLKFLVDLY